MSMVRIHKWHVGLALALIGIALMAYDAWWHSTYGVGTPEVVIGERSSRS